MNHLLLLASFMCHPGALSPSYAHHAVITRRVASAVLTMPRQPVRSSNIASIGYDASTATLEVEFVTGAVYQYYGVPKSVYEGLMNAKSHGGYLAHYVKDAGYRHKEVQ
jgi:hypothetical protein